MVAMLSGLLWTVFVGPGPATQPATELTAHVELSWAAPNSCPGLDWGTRRIESFLGRSMDEAARENWDFGVTLGRVEHGFEVGVESTSALGNSTRQLGDGDCRILADAVAFIIASTIDPDVIHVELEEEDPEPAVTTAVDETSEAPEPLAVVEDVPPTPSKRFKPGFRVRAETTGLAGSLPDLSGGVGALVALTLGERLRVELGGSYGFARPALVAASTPLGGDISLASATLRGCATPGFETMAFPVCLGLQAGAMIGKPIGTDTSADKRLPWLAFELGGGINWQFSSRLSLWLEVDALTPLVVPRFELASSEEVFSPASLGLRGALGVEVRIW